ERSPHIVPQGLRVLERAALPLRRSLHPGAPLTGGPVPEGPPPGDHEDPDRQREEPDRRQTQPFDPPTHHVLQGTPSAKCPETRYSWPLSTSQPPRNFLSLPTTIPWGCLVPGPSEVPEMFSPIGQFQNL